MVNVGDDCDVSNFHIFTNNNRPKKFAKIYKYLVNRIFFLIFCSGGSRWLFHTKFTAYFQDSIRLDAIELADGTYSRPVVDCNPAESIS